MDFRAVGSQQCGSSSPIVAAVTVPRYRREDLIIFAQDDYLRAKNEQWCYSVGSPISDVAASQWCVVAACYDGSIHLFAAETLSCTGTFRLPLSGGELLKCAIQGDYVACAYDTTVITIHMSRLLHPNPIASEPVAKILDVTKAHNLHTSTVSCLAFTERAIVSGDESGQIVVASLAHMQPLKLGGSPIVNDDDEDESAAEDAVLLGSYYVGESVSAVNFVTRDGDVAIVMTGTEQFCVIKVPGVRAGTAEVVELYPLSDAVRNCEHLKTAEGSFGRIVASFFDPISARPFLLGSSVEGVLCLFELTQDGRVTLAGRFLSDSPTKIHVDLVRAAILHVQDKVMFTTFDDAGVCIDWAF